MSYLKLDHKKVEMRMNRMLIRPADLARKLHVSRQMANYILHQGGVKYASKLAKILNCEREFLTVKILKKK